MKVLNYNGNQRKSSLNDTHDGRLPEWWVRKGKLQELYKKCQAKSEHEKRKV